MPDPEHRQQDTKDSRVTPGPVPVARAESPGAADDREGLRRENERLRRELAERPDAKEADQLAKENDLLRNQLSKVPPQGPPRSTVVHFRRGKEEVCRPALVASDGFLDSVRLADGSLRWHALLQYGEPYTEPQRGHSFQTNRGYDPGGNPDTWHAPDQCTLGYKEQTTFPDAPDMPKPVAAVQAP